MRTNLIYLLKVHKSQPSGIQELPSLNILVNHIEMDTTLGIRAVPTTVVPPDAAPCHTTYAHCGGCPAIRIQWAATGPMLGKITVQ